MDNVYNETTEPQAKPSRRPFGCTLRHLRGWRLPTKALQGVSPLLASPRPRREAAGAAGGESPPRLPSDPPGSSGHGWRRAKAAKRGQGGRPLTD